VRDIGRARFGRAVVTFASTLSTAAPLAHLHGKAPHVDLGGQSPDGGLRKGWEAFGSASMRAAYGIGAISARAFFSALRNCSRCS